jgi:hypothetical protein
MMQDDIRNEYSKFKVELEHMLDSSMNQGYIEFSVFQKLRKMDEFIPLQQQLQ